MTENEKINGWTYEETIKTTENLMEAEQNMFKWDALRHLRDFAEAFLEELMQYRAIGTLEECREAAIKQTAKKPIFNHNLSDTLSVFHCECGSAIKASHDIGIMNNNNAPNYCSKCGCRLDWSDEE